MEQLIFFLLNVSDTDPNTATSVAPATTCEKRWIQLNHFHTTESDRGHQTKVEERTDSVVEALNVRCQNRISNLRLFLDSSEYISVVCHLHKGANHVEYTIITSHFPAPAFLIETWSTTYSWKKSTCGSDNYFCTPGKDNYKKFSTLSLWTKKTPYLRYPLWGNKTGGLDHWQACFRKHVYQLDFLSRRNNFLKYNETKNSLNWLWWEVEHNGLCSRHQSRLPFPFVCTIFAISGITGVQQKGGEAVPDEVKQSKWLISPALILM